MTELLLISLGTTRGLGVADSMLLLEMLAQAGAEVEAVGVAIGAAGALRRGSIPSTTWLRRWRRTAASRRR